MIYLIVFLLLICLSYIYDIREKTENRLFWYNVMLVIFVLVAGLRWRLGVDTPNYLGSFYHEYPTLGDFSLDDYDIASSPLYVLINSFVKSLGGKFYIVQIIHATFINILIFKFIKRHSSYIFTCLFFYAIICYTTYNMETMRASMSIVVCLYANDFIIEKKWLKAYLLYIIAFLFHAEAIVMFILPLLSFLKFNKVGAVFLVIAFLLGIKLTGMLENYLALADSMPAFDGEDTLESKIINYMSSDEYGSGKEGGIIFYILKYIMPLAYLVCSLLYIKRFEPDSSLLKLEPFLIIGLAFLLIQCNLFIAYRLVDCFKIYFVLFYSELFVSLILKAKNLELSLSCARSLVLFFPLVFYIVFYDYFSDGGKGFRYYPYNSVIERKIDTKRQLKYNEIFSTKYPTVNKEEY